MSASDGIELVIAPSAAGTRLDVVIADHLDGCSRSYAAKLVRQAFITVDGLVRKPSYKVKSGDRLSGVLPEPEPADILPEPIALDILYADDAVIVLNKRAGLVVHPAAGHPGGTLVNALLYHFPNIEGIGGETRPGIVHRLDKDTSGIMVVAKDAVAHHALSEQFKDRTIEKEYLALVSGQPAGPEGTIDLPIGRHPTDRKKMSTSSRHGRPAMTVWRIKEPFGAATLLAVDLKTGRTHQIRVHCQAMGHPIVGDPVYGGRSQRRFTAKEAQRTQQLLNTAQRQMLHAHRLTFTHPIDGERYTFEAPPAPDMLHLLHALRGITEAVSAGGPAH